MGGPEKKKINDQFITMPNYSKRKYIGIKFHPTQNL